MSLDAKEAIAVRKMLPRKMAKYYLQRYSLFSKFDRGVQVGTCLLLSSLPCPVIFCMVDLRFAAPCIVVYIVASKTF